MLIPTCQGKKYDIGKYCIVLELTQMGKNGKKVTAHQPHALHWLVDTCAIIIFAIIIVISISIPIFSLPIALLLGINASSQ